MSELDLARMHLVRLLVFFRSRLAKGPRRRCYCDIPLAHDQVEDLAENIKTYGQITPIVISPSNVILSGHRRVSAMKLLGKTYIECAVVDVEPEEEIIYIIMANIQRQKDMVQLSNEIEILYELYSPGQGYRSDLNGSSVFLLLWV